MPEIKNLLPNDKDEQQKGRYGRCKYYWTVERYCFETLRPHQGLPEFIGTFRDEEGLEWLVFQKITATRDTKNPALSMQDLIDMDLEDHQKHPEKNRLLNLSAALGVKPESDGDEYLIRALDTLLEQILEILIHIHEQGIVHRDLKPGNLLVADGNIYLIDFGSAADLKTAGVLKQNIGLSEKVAISPIYAAPELFVDAYSPRSAVNFDCFSAALIFCQVLFQYLDERTDAGFFRQLAEADYSLDTWLETELAQDVRSTGLEQGLAILAYRPGLWNLLQKMLLSDPRDRISSKDALQAWKTLKGEAEAGKSVGEHAKLDGRYLADVLESFDLCSIVDDLMPDDAPVARPLHYVATFRRGEPLGLLLAESDADVLDNMSGSDIMKWREVQQNRLPGQVFVQGVVPNSQADEIGIFEVGDRLQGVGELPLREGGFEKAVKLIQDQPQNSKYITLHLDRRPSNTRKTLNELAEQEKETKNSSVIRDQGAWSSRGRRSSQEDRFILNEIHDEKERSFLFAGVFDGHLGTAASNFVQDRLPRRLLEIFTESGSRSISTSVALERAWNEVCEEYRASCSGESECVADYDPREGTLDAYTGSNDAVAGTTGSVVAFEQSEGVLTVLNCGDSRTMVIDSNGNVVFRTQDHQPEYELDRFSKGIRDGLPYSQPECRFSKWRVAVGDYNYAVSRSLEGPFATRRGIISTPDVATVRTLYGMTVVVASDGLWEVMDVNEIAQVLKRLRENEVTAADASKTLCSLALEKGSRDNVSAVVVYVD